MGLASLVGGALMTGTASRDFDAIHAALEDIGADLGFRGHRHKLGFSGKSLAEDLPTLIEVANDALRNPVFPDDHVERLRGERLTWLQYSNFDTRYRAFKGDARGALPAVPPLSLQRLRQRREHRQGITPDDLRRFHAEHYGPRDMILVIVGAVAAAEAVALASAAFGDWRHESQPAVRQVEKPAGSGDSRRQVVVVPGKTQSDISMGVFGPARLADDYLPAQLANSILGEFGMMGRIGKSVREEKGLAYYAFSRLGGGHGPEPWSISAGVNPENVDLAIASALEEIERLTSELVSDADLADNQSYFTGRMPLRLESNEGIASDIHGMESFGLGLDYLANYQETIYRISKDDLLAAARRYLGAGDMVIAVAGPARDSAST